MLFLYKYHKKINKIKFMELLLIILLTYGMSNIIVFGSIFEKTRETLEVYSPNFFGKLVNCMMCTPFWVGFILSTTSIVMGYNQLSPFYSHGVTNVLFSIFLDSCLLSGTTWLIHTIQEKLEV